MGESALTDHCLGDPRQSSREEEMKHTGSLCAAGVLILAALPSSKGVNPGADPSVIGPI